MSRLGELLGSKTRGNVVEALAMSERPLTCYRISKLYNMNVAKVYVAMKKLAALGLVTPSRGRGGIEYRLQNEDLCRLALNFSTRVVTYKEWSSQGGKKKRFRFGLAQIPALPLDKSRKLMSIKPTRIPGELDNLALLARAKFDGKYRKGSDGAYDSLR
jgi:hypothetical protein